MILRFLLLLSYFLVGFYGFGQSMNMDWVLHEIDTKVKNIDSSKYKDKQRFKVQNFPMDSVFISVYQKNKKYRKIFFEGYNGGLKTEKSFYSQDDNLFYTKEKTFIPTGRESSPVKINHWEETNKIQSYFQEQKLVRQLDSEDGGHPFSREYLDAEGESLLDDYRTLILLIGSKDSSKGKH
ncbi:hypothetical protein [Costertonia aggregata]|uniref:Uncharacterized protein n=1 Tax=Costertonia aggregata TaxID=343403 RepID=A0A7H9AL62_9FLAO|nr:hypothetical protein [Costertonia aggregata]QLG44200.1 hypothetical protein HYG79_02165 [Costertonia aggregata]